MSQQEEQSEFMNVVSDYQVQSFDSELGSMSLEKMMSIQYSEEILQKNFNVIIKILKQLHQTHIEMQNGIKKNREGLDNMHQYYFQLKEQVEINEEKAQKSVEEFQTLMDLFKRRIDRQDREFQFINETFAEQQQGIEQLQNNDKIMNMNLENQQQSQQDLQDRLIKVENEQRTSQMNYDNLFVALKAQVEQIQTNLDEIQKKTSTPKPISFGRPLQSPRKKTASKAIEQNQESRVATQQKLTEEKRVFQEEKLVERVSNLSKLEIKFEENQSSNQEQKHEEQQSQKSFDLINIEDNIGATSNDLVSIQKQLNYHDEELLRMSDLVPRLQNQEEEIQKLWDKIDQIGSSDLVSQYPQDSTFLEQMKNQMRILQSQVDQMQTSVNLLVPMNGNGEVGENQMGVILAEINKVRAQLDKYILTQDFQNEINNLKQQTKKLGDMIPENGDRVRRDIMLKLNHKLDTTEAIKIVNEINFLKEQIQYLQNLKNQNSGGQTNVSAQLDPAVLTKIQNQGDQIHNLENDLKTLRIQYTAFVGNNNNKISDIEKKLQSLQIDRIFSEMQIIREIAELAKKDSDFGSKRIKEIKKSLENYVSKDDIEQIIQNQLKEFKQEVYSQVREIEELVYGKVNAEDLTKVEQNVLQKLEEVVSALVKQLANKSETKKALIYLESKLNQIFLLLEGGETQKDGDGLFAKRPMLWSCASCDKDLDKYKGQLGDYRGWAIFPPKETNPERLGRFGVGFKNQQEKHRYVREKLDKERDKYETNNLNSQNASLTFQKTQGQDGFYTENAHRSNASIANLNEHLPKINQK